MSQKKSIFKRWWFWLIVGLVIFTIIGAMMPADEDTNTPDDTDQIGSSDTITDGVILDSKDSFQNSDTGTTDTATQNSSTDTQKPASTSTQKPASTSTQAPASTQTSDTGTTSDKVSDTPSSGGAVIVPDNNQNEVVYVWIPNYENGKYHRTSDCSGMKSPIKVTLEEAIRLGFGPCQRKKCYG